MVRTAQLASVFIAFVLVVAAGGYGITRGILDDGHKFGTTCRTGTAQWIPGVDALSLPTRLPTGMRLATACYTTGDIADTTVFYENAERDKVFLISMLEIGELLPTSEIAPPGDPVQLGNVVGYYTEKEESDGNTLHRITFEKEVWNYSVAAIIGSENKVTPDELKAVARNMAER